MRIRLALALGLLLLAAVVLVSDVLLYWWDNGNLSAGQVLQAKWKRCLGVLFVLWMAGSVAVGRALVPAARSRKPRYVVNARRRRQDR